MREEKRKAIVEKLECHHGASTLREVFNYLPPSCKDLPRNQIADILNACVSAFRNGKNADARESRDFNGSYWWAD